MSNFHFLLVHKIAVLSNDKKKVLLCKRKGEDDYNDFFTLIGGKMETSDESPVESMRREKNEEIGESCKLFLYPTFSINVYWKRKDGKEMLLPHHLAVHQEGDVQINDEYSDYKWVPIEELEEFNPKIDNITEITKKLLEIEPFEKNHVLI